MINNNRTQLLCIGHVLYSAMTWYAAGSINKSTTPSPNTGTGREGLKLSRRRRRVCEPAIALYCAAHGIVSLHVSPTGLVVITAQHRFIFVVPILSITLGAHRNEHSLAIGDQHSLVSYSTAFELSDKEWFSLLRPMYSNFQHTHKKNM